MAEGDEPVGELCRLVNVGIEHDLEAGPAQCSGRIQVGRGMVGRVGIDDHEEFNLVTVQLIDQFAQSGRLFDRIDGNGVTILYTGTNGSQGEVDRVGQGVELGWLSLTDQNQASTTGSTQIGSGGLDKGAGRGRQVYLTTQTGETQSLSERKTNASDQTSLHR